jgi:hypothetical protein
VLEADGVCVLRFADGDVIEATAEHPFFVPGRGWIYAAGLKTGDRVKSTFASSAVVSVTYRAGATKVYNFEVARTHTYYVGAGKLVHNRCAIGAGVYALVDDAGIIRYVGQSKQMSVRAAQHARDPIKGGFSFRVLAEGVTDRGERLLLEQMHINLNGGVKGGQLLNVRNAIGASKPYHVTLPR